MPAPRSLINVVLLLLVAGLAALAYLRPGTEAPADTPLTGLDPAQVRSIRIDNARGRIELVRSNGGWRLREPGLRADAFQIGILLDLLQSRSERRYPLAEIDPADIGLDPPRATLQYDDTEIRLGNTEPLQDLRYAQHGDQVHLIQDRVPHLLTASPTDLASRRLLPEDTEIERLELPGFTLTRTDTGGWDISPEHPDVSADRLQQLVDGWRSARALWVREDSGGDTGNEIEVTLAGGERIRFAIRRSESDFVLVRQDLGLEYHLGTQQGGRLLELGTGEDEKSAPEP